MHDLQLEAVRVAEEHRVVARLEPPVVDVRSAEWLSRDTYRLRPDARRFETWEMNYAAVLGLGAAIDYAIDWDLAQTYDHIRQLADTLRARLGQIPGVTIHDTGQAKCGIVTFSVEGLSAEQVKNELAERACTVSVSRLGSQLLDFEERGITQVVRASIHYFNDRHELDQFASIVEQLSLPSRRGREDRNALAGADQR